jgi:hypothetical protein
MRGKTLIITAMIMVVIFMGTTSATGQTDWQNIIKHTFRNAS